MENVVRYQLLDQVGLGGMGTVYRAQDRLTGQTVALKRVNLNNRSLTLTVHNTLDVRIALAQEFKTLASMRHPNIISVLDYGFVEDGQPYFTMELLENARTFIEAGRISSHHSKIDLLIQVLQALSYLHRRGIIHRDLKPANVLVVENRVKVVDFGLAVTREYLPSDAVAGTLAYIAPEVIKGFSASEASDLYALGVMAYELFSGQHPFNIQSPVTLIEEIIGKVPDVNSLDVEEELTLIISRLMNKQPEDRYRSAADVITALLKAVDRPVTTENSDIRESFLQAAQFVGRDTELKRLTDALRAALKNGGSAWLVGGESGVGKSRLLDELRTLALVEGLVVLRGQAASTGHIPYQLWREPVRRLLLLSDVTPLERSVLKEIVPDIETLLEIEVPDAPELEGKGRQQRLVMAIVDLFRKQTQAILLLLEDMHWVQESLEPLKHLVRIVADKPLFIVGSYRDDETPHLPDELPEMQVLKLERLTPEAIAELSASILGETGQYPQVIDMLARETEGNTFFIVEVMRTLVEEYGGLDQIGVMTLPSRIVSGGIQAVIERRLSRIRADAKPLLKLAAIIGRQLDLNLLQGIAPDTNLEKWLIDCAEVALLEVHDEQWRFAHDKLREALLASITDDERVPLYRQVAETTEKLYGHDPVYAASLADYWLVAQNANKSVEYACRAGEQAIGLSSYQDALKILHRALDLDVEKPQKMPVHALLGDAYWRIGEYPEAKKHYEQGLALARERNDSPMIAEILNGIALVNYMTGASQDAITYASEAKETALQNSQRKNTARALNTLGMVTEMDGDFDTANQYYKQGIEIFRAIGDLRGTASALNNLGSIADSRGELDIARTYYEESLDLCKAIGYRQGVGALLNNLGVVAERLHDYEAYDESRVLTEQIGNRRGRMQSLANIVFVCIELGQIEEARIALNMALKLLKPDDTTIWPHVLAGLARVKLVEGQVERTAEIAGFIKTLPGAYADFITTRFEPLMSDLQKVLVEATLNAALERGAKLDQELFLRESVK